MKTNEQSKITNRSSVSEKGHAKNIANFETEITFCIGYGANYNPTNPNLTIPNLQSKWEAAKQKLRTVKDTKIPFDEATGNRQMLFKPVKPLATRVINALVAQNVPITVIKDARSIIRKLTGKRASNEKTATLEENQISVSQQSYDRLVDSLEELIVLAQNETRYNPNEDEIKIQNLLSTLELLTKANTEVKNAYVPYSKAMIARNRELYEDETGLVKTAQNVKKYVKSVFGAASPEYRQISGLEFREPAE